MIWRANFWEPFTLGLFLLLSWVGWGAALQRLLKLNRGVPAGWALRAGWGMSAVLALGGLLNALRLVSLETDACLTLAGLSFFTLDLYKRATMPTARQHLLRPLRHGRWIWLIPIVLVGGFNYFASIEGPIDYADDAIAYLPFIQKMVQTGTLIDPFSWRRLSTYGGQQFLQSSMLLLGRIDNIGAIDVGLCPLIVAGMVWQMLRPRTTVWRALAAGIACLVLVIPVPHINTQSQATGLVLFMTLLSTLHLQRWDGRKNRRVAICLGMIGAALASLRANYLPTAVLAIGLSVLGLMLCRRRDWRAHAANGFIAAASFGVCLAPWALVLWQSSRSLYYPVMHGLFRAKFNLSDDTLGAVRQIIFVTTVLVFAPLLAAFLPIGLAFRKRFLRDLLPMFAAALVTTILTAWAFSAADAVNIYRYSHAGVMAAALGAIACTLRKGGLRQIRAVAAGVLLLLLAGANVDGIFNQCLLNYRIAVDAATQPRQILPVNWPALYHEAQENIPVGARVLVVASPLYFDFRRNVIEGVDFPGAASPDPGMPVLQGPEAIKAYLKNQDIHYIIVCNFRSHGELMYSFRVWIGMLLSSEAPVLKMSGKYMLPFLHDMEFLEQTNDIVYTNELLRVIHLR
jgi:hypothetical protein